jgi:predicted DNA binding protein
MKKQKDKEMLLEQLKKTPIVEIACSKLGIGRTTYYRWRKENAEFATHADEAIRDGILLVSDMAEAELISAIKNGQLPAIIFWLRNRHEAYKTKVEVNGQIKQSDERLTPEQAAIVEQALRLALPDKTNDETK